jgi:hypothetical protein
MFGDFACETSQVETKIRIAMPCLRQRIISESPEPENTHGLLAKAGTTATCLWQGRWIDPAALFSGPKSLYVRAKVVPWRPLPDERNSLQS